VKSLRLVVVILLGLMLAITPLLGACAEEEAPPPPPAEEEEAPPPPPPPPEKPIVLTYGQTEGPEHTFSQADQLWIDKIEKDTNGRVDIVPYWGATLLSRAENTAELIAGVADLGYLSPRTGFPIMLGTLGFPFGVPDWETDVAIYDELFEKFPEMDAEWAALKIMAKSVASNYQLISTKPVRTLDDFKGMIIKATGMYIDAMKALGADSFYVAMGETYVALQKGTIDACLAPYDTLKSFSFYEVAKYVTILDLQSAVRPTRGMNWDSYNSLPADIPKIFDDSIAFWSLEDNKARERVNQEGIALAEEHGVEFIELSAADLAELYKVMDTVCRAEAAKLDDEGLPGTEIYEELRRLVEEYAK
jgi:TRAP-type C4-dicarboxylate transport system substrate-binding protein